MLKRRFNWITLSRVVRWLRQSTVILCLISWIPRDGLALQQPDTKRNRDTERTSPAQRELDSLKVLLKKTISETEKAEIYGQLCTTYVGVMGDVAIGRLYADSIKMLADKSSAKSLIATSHYYYGLIERYEGKYPEALDHFQLQLDYCKTSGDSSRMAGTFFQLAVVQQSLGNYEESLATSFAAVKLFEKKGASLGLAGTYMHLGNLFDRLKNTQEAIAMHKQALMVFDSLEPRLKVNLNKVRVSINLGNSYADLKQYDTAMRFYNQALVISRRLGSPRTTATALSNIGAVLFALKQYDSAKLYQLDALTIREKTSQRDKVPISLLDVGETYAYLGNYPLATRYLLRGLSMAKASKSRPLIRNAYEKLSALYSIQQNYAKAYEYHQLFTAMQDSVLNEEKAQQVRELHAKYETSEKDKKIQLLATAKEMQKKESERRATLNKIFVAGSGSVAMVGTLLFFIFRQRLHLIAKNDEVKEAAFRAQISELEMKALRAQINPNFLYNCMTAIDQMIINGQTESASLYLTKFSRLVRLILESSETSAVTLEKEMALLECYLQLEELRLPGRIDYTISVDESICAESTYLPSMLLQPVVENAIWHGIAHKEDDAKGNIFIDVKQHDDQLLCTIEDNGVGRDLARQISDKRIVQNKSLGMKVTEERLRLRSRKSREQYIQIADLKDTSNHPVGTRVTLHIPIAEQND